MAEKPQPGERRFSRPDSLRSSMAMRRRWLHFGLYECLRQTRPTHVIQDVPRGLRPDLRRQAICFDRIHALPSLDVGPP